MFIEKKLSKGVVSLFATILSLTIMFAGCKTSSSSSDDDGDDSGTVLVTGITVSAASTTIEAVDGTTTVTASVTPSNASNSSVSWSSGNESIATVAEDNGTVTVTAVAEGVVAIYATAKDGSGVKGSISIKIGSGSVSCATSVDVTASGSATSVEVGSTLQFTATVAPSVASDTTVTWSSSDTSKATVSVSGLVTGKATGSVIITATANGAASGSTVSDSYNLTVSAATDPNTGGGSVTALAIAGASTVIAGNSQLYTVSVTPTNADNKLVAWTISSDSSSTGAEIGSSTGSLTTTSGKTGSITIKATAQDGSGVTATKVVSIAQESTSNTDNTSSAGSTTNNGVTITDAGGWLQSCYVEWKPSSDTSVTGYNVYVQSSIGNWKQLDDMLVRQYTGTSGTYSGTYYRADAMGLAAGTYNMKVICTVSGSETGSASTATGMAVGAFDRSGFAFTGDEMPGAYKADGTLKDDTQIFYITNENAKTITGSVNGYIFTGFQDLCYALQKKSPADNPVCIRIVGMILADNMDSFGSSSEGLQIKGKGSYSKLTTTIEGVGEDAGIYKFGMLLRNAGYVEISNIAVMLCMDDSISFDTDNNYCWVHNCDLFYGNAGGDADQAKGDGTIDVKGDSQYMTFSYNHFWDNGKSSLCGMTSESGPNYITYHHNWFDHSDSRHPRIRTMTVHVYNNYYDGNSKYGVGSTTDSDVFVEANYFRNCKHPILISEQGSDLYSTGNVRTEDYGTFSGENGGMVKSYNNYMTGTYTYIPYGATSIVQAGTTYNASERGIDTTVDFDAYEVASKDEPVPSTIKAYQGSAIYSNFDTDSSVMYSYTADEPIAAKGNVEKYAGRENHGDFTWTFDNSTEDTNYSVITALKTALGTYTTTLIKSLGSTYETDDAGTTVLTDAERVSYAKTNLTSALASVYYTTKTATESAIQAVLDAETVDVYGTTVKYESNETAQTTTVTITYGSTSDTIVISAPSDSVKVSTTKKEVNTAIASIIYTTNDETKTAVDSAIEEMTKTFTDVNVETAIDGTSGTITITITSGTETDTITITKPSAAERVAATKSVVNTAVSSITYSVTSSASDIVTAVNDALTTAVQSSYAYETSVAVAADVSTRNVVITVSSTADTSVTDTITITKPTAASYVAAAKTAATALVAWNTDVATTKTAVDAQLESTDTTGVYALREKYYVTITDSSDTDADTVTLTITSTDDTSVSGTIVLKAFSGYSKTYSGTSYLVDSNSFFTSSGSLKTLSSTVTVDGTDYTTGLKMDSNASISFDTTTIGETTLTIHYSSKNATNTLYIDSTSVTCSNGATGGVITQTLSAGSHTVKKNSGESYVLMIQVK